MTDTTPERELPFEGYEAEIAAMDRTATAIIEYDGEIEVLDLGPLNGVSEYCRVRDEIAASIANAKMKSFGFPRREVVGTASHIIGMYRVGLLVPGDKSLDVMIYDAENAHLVQEYLDQLASEAMK